jgi:hypothetical protein
MPQLDAGSIDVVAVLQPSVHCIGAENPRVAEPHLVAGAEGILIARRDPTDRIAERL